MNPLDKLTAYFEKFPGVGLRQARRFAFHILTLPETDTREIASLITSLSDSVTECERCHRFFSESGNQQPRCKICRDENRDVSKVLIVARDSDIDAIERSRVYDGYYFVLGGTVPLLANPADQPKVRAGAFKALVEREVESKHLTEVILAFAVNPDGENTSRFIESILRDFEEKQQLTISYLGRGLSTGSELEYADPETIKQALAHRTGHTNEKTVP
jgi:recombination protein RecR